VEGDVGVEEPAAVGVQRGVVVVVEGTEGERGAFVEEVDGSDGDCDAGEPAVELGAVVAQAEVEGRPAGDGVLVVAASTSWPRPSLRSSRFLTWGVPGRRKDRSALIAGTKRSGSPSPS